MNLLLEQEISTTARRGQGKTWGEVARGKGVERAIDGKYAVFLI